MLYIVIASYKKPSDPMSYSDAVKLVQSLRVQNISAHLKLCEA